MERRELKNFVEIFGEITKKKYTFAALKLYFICISNVWDRRQTVCCLLARYK